MLSHLPWEQALDLDGIDPLSSPAVKDRWTKTSAAVPDDATLQRALQSGAISKDQYDALKAAKAASTYVAKGEVTLSLTLSLTLTLTLKF